MSQATGQKQKRAALCQKDCTAVTHVRDVHIFTKPRKICKDDFALVRQMIRRLLQKSKEKWVRVLGNPYPWPSLGRVYHSLPQARQIQKNIDIGRHNGLRILSPKLKLYLKAETNANCNLALLAFLHSMVTTFPTLCTTLSSYSPITISMTSVTSQWSNNIFRATPVPPPCRPPW